MPWNTTVQIVTSPLRTLRFALEAAKYSGVPWENFKHRHENRGSKWTVGIKNVPVVDNRENPGIYGGPKDVVIPLNHQTIEGDSSDSPKRSSRHASPEPDAPSDAANGDHPYHRSRDTSKHMGGHQQSSPDRAKQHRQADYRRLGMSHLPTGDGSGEAENLIYLPEAYPSADHQVDDYSQLAGQRGPPTIRDAEQAVEFLMTFLDNALEKLIPRVVTLQERDILRHMKLSSAGQRSACPLYLARTHKALLWYRHFPLLSCQG
ncbi:hypothetical protein BKA70DRAFT_1448176 [Coprinopsis sp. MPI-PUGE-AT-0042]|nr:hypothetical protein BKA70DRAFT_1448176 [Coprinopsis sp. MPI-PUGE-AT-0042]